jgi:hypothetical protein
VLHQIGIGALGPVFRTYEPTRDRLVAVKVFRLDIIPEQAHVLADALSRATESSLCHPSIVEPLAAGVEGTLAYRAEEYVAAESLDVAMRHYAPAAIEKALPFITQLAGAIDFARAAGVGHGGLHPRDIFVTPDEARATGFGVVEALEEVGIRAPIRRPYTAPERIEGGAWGTPADVFSLGAITFELLTGRRPAGTGARAGTLPATERSAALRAVLARAMDDQPERRYGSALAFAGALESAARGDAEASAESDVAAIALPVPASVTKPEAQERVPAPTPGEFAIEDELDAVHEALEEFALEPELFADDFVEEEPRLAVASDNRVAEESVYAAEEPMFAAAEPEPEHHDVAERSGPAILPIAVTLVLGLLGGFAAGYFVGSRDRLAPAVEAAPAASAQPAPAGPATPEKPGQYSEHKVTPPAVSAVDGAPVAAPASAPPPAPAPAAAAPAESPAPIPNVAPRPERAASAGHLVVKSTPSRAAVTVNGKWQGRTPLTLDELPFGKYAVRVVQNGFQVAREDVTLNPRNPSRTINARLEPNARAAAGRPDPAPVAFTGSLYVDSRPRGATVLVDGRSVGQTPITLADLSIGSHVVRIEMAGKKPWTSTARVAAGKTTPVTGSLEDKP